MNLFKSAFAKIAQKNLESFDTYQKEDKTESAKEHLMIAMRYIQAMLNIAPESSKLTDEENNLLQILHKRFNESSIRREEDEKLYDTLIQKGFPSENDQD